MGSEFKIVIAGDASSAVAAGKAAADSLTNVGNAAQAAGQKLDVGLGGKDIVDAMQGAGKASKETGDHIEQSGKKFKLFGGHGKELKNTIRELGQEFPLAGQALRLLTNPIALGLSVAIGIFSKTKEAIEKMNETVGESAQWTSLKESVDKTKEAFEAAELGARSYDRGLERILHATQTVTEKSNELLAVMHAMRAAQNDVESAQKELEVAKAGAIQDPVKRAEAMLAIEEKYAAIKKKHADEDALREEGENHRRLANEQIAAKVLSEQLAAARERQKLTGTEEGHKSKVEVDKKNLDATVEERQKKQARIDEIEKGSRLFRMTATQEELVALKQQVEQLDKLEMQQRKLVGQDKKALPGKLDASRTAGETVADFEAKLKAAHERIAALETAIPQQARIHGIEAAGRDQAEGLRSQARRQTTRTQIEGMVTEGIERDPLAYGLRQFADTSGQTDRASLDILSGLVNANKANREEIENLRRALARDQGQR